MENILERHQELKEEVEDTLRSYELDKKQLEHAQRNIVKSELEYYKAKMELLEFIIKNNLTNEKSI